MTSIIVSAIALFIFGALWYTIIFGRTWSKLMGMSPEQMEKAKKGGMAGKMVVMFILNLLTVLSVSYLLPQVLALSFKEFYITIFIIWLGFSFPLLMGGYLWEGRSWKLVLLNAVYGILSLKLVSAIIYFWK